MPEHVERERKWLVADLPDDLGAGTPIRQGYLAGQDSVTLRIRQKGAAYIGTVKAGAAPARVEVEWELSADQFEALWPFTAGRRVAKVRHEVPVEGGTAEVDVFEGDLAGLLLVEVEFDDDDSMAAFEAPSWFGPDVTDHGGYGNATLAVDGIPADHPG